MDLKEQRQLAGVVANNKLAHISRDNEVFYNELLGGQASWEDAVSFMRHYQLQIPDYADRELITDILGPSWEDWTP